MNAMDYMSHSLSLRERVIGHLLLFGCGLVWTAYGDGVSRTETTMSGLRFFLMMGV
jgi:hypothetical protein